MNWMLILTFTFNVNVSMVTKVPFASRDLCEDGFRQILSTFVIGHKIEVIGVCVKTGGN